jgi:hypothetical protein
MKLVIEIEDKIYNDIKHGKIYSSIYDVPMESVLAIANGTPLPKGHGRLGDLDALEKEIVNGIKAGNYEEGYETFAHINDMDDCVECVKYADTIIEADVEESEG